MLVMRSVSFNREVGVSNSTSSGLSGNQSTGRQSMFRNVSKNDYGDREDETCYKPAGAISYRVCKKLPYLRINCGVKEKNARTYKVPNVVHFIWFGSPSFRFYNYMAMRSVASHQQPEKILFHFSKTKPKGTLWERIVAELPCLELRKIEAPKEVLGVKISRVIPQTDAARMQILLKSGGIYIDNDVITLRNLNSLRNYSVTFGRSVGNVISMGVVLAEPNSTFLTQFYHEYPKHFDRRWPWAFTTRYLGEYYRKQFQLGVHVEETSMQRPNPYQKVDGGVSATTLAHWDLSKNYFLHIHPQKSLQNPVIDRNFGNWNAHILRKMDNVFGEAARRGLFGSADLIFSPGEKTRERVDTFKVSLLAPLRTQHTV
ncbi:unnamed protein product [Clavelina lepadiformis]|uniref:Alpha 1,4-glycosyltransferase domain-containing protein n=1 Tax=Clavelina lepadiformis TaxID=159417 RepID=A0ABP0GTV4_CLALP